jgi:DNA-binding MarR family transcriptional regulator
VAVPFHAVNAPDEDDDPEHAHGASRAIVDLARLAELALARVDLTLTQYRVLAHLDRGRSIQTNLAFKLAVTRQNVTRIVDVLVARGLVERSPDSVDRRRVHHGLTPAGRRTVAEADRAIDKDLHAVLRDLEDPEDERIVLHALDLVNAAVLASFERIRPVTDVRPGEKYSTRPPKRS